jgi:hypothetical protein
MPKRTADAFRSMANGPALQSILDRSQPVDALLEPVAAHWSYDLYSRRPGPALLENGVLKPTDLDLACFLSALTDRGAVINLPTYKSRRPKTEREGEHVVSAANRHGPVVGLVSNKATLSFSVLVRDHNVIVAGDEARGVRDSVGAYRAFMLVDLEGAWHEGWKRIEFMPSAKENDFLTDKRLWTGNTVVFENFVHPNRWVSLYGSHYFLTKCLIQRLKEEVSHYNALLKAFPGPAPAEGEEDEGGVFTPSRKTERGEARAIEVQAFEVETDAPWRGEFPPLPGTDAVSVAAMRERCRRLRYEVVPEMQFAVRATELAFVRAGLDAKGFPSWISGARWEHGYVQPKKRKEWSRLVMTQLAPGQMGFALRYRTWAKTEQVAPSSEED